MSAPELLVAFDGSAASENAIRVAGALLPDASATVVTAYSSPVSSGQVLFSGALPTAEAHQTMEELRDLVRSGARETAEAGAQLAASSGASRPKLSLAKALRR